MIRSFVNKNANDWDLHIGILMAAYRSTVHPATGYSPNMLMLGREITLPPQIIFPFPNCNESMEVETYVSKMRSKLEEIYQLAREHLRSSAVRQKKITTAVYPKINFVKDHFKMSEIYNCNWTDCLYEGNKRDTIWHILLSHVQEDQVPFHCNICHFRGNTRRNMDRHILSYKPHLEKMEELGIQSSNNCIIKSANPYFVKLGTDTSCDATYKDQSYIVTEVVESIIEIREDSGEFNITDTSCQTEETFITFRELKAEVNIMKGSHQAELNRFGDYIARLEKRLKMKEEEIKSAERKLRKNEEGSRKQLKEKDDLIRTLEWKLRHKGNKVEVLRRKLRVDEFDSEEEKENGMPRKKLKGYVVKKLF
ncbi:unnamed protein product [Mytilus edulis]|uniref:Uncharacterized protein n=1 Tax=Mytilus edulis TaxID=6550 RepID=A0A8S3S5B9_MYTED|nr:unnamed protein product [Mytilus edulis]